MTGSGTLPRHTFFTPEHTRLTVLSQRQSRR